MFESTLNIEEIKKRIDRYRNGELICSDGLFSDIFGENFKVVVGLKIFPKGLNLYRARSIPDSDHFVPLKTISRVEDAWEPPAEIIKTQGRLNKVGESILYCCPNDPMLAIVEARAQGNKRVAIMNYKTTKDLTVACLGDYEHSDLPKDEGTKLFYSFLNDEFSQDIKHGEEYKYCLTQSIADSYFNYPNQDAWYYRSVQSSEKFNLAFLPGKAKSNLELIGVMICDLNRTKDGKLSVVSFVDFDHETGEAQYHLGVSEIQKKFFT
ncbi:RES domain-containing protein [Acinetobacter bereziniae]|uniref:RES domain-containing protein n=1 Tax=Acinetobacter bereziniae TaxID=106648 RepID=UPI003AF4AD1F